MWAHKAHFITMITEDSDIVQGKFVFSQRVSICQQALLNNSLVKSDKLSQVVEFIIRQFQFETRLSLD